MLCPLDNTGTVVRARQFTISPVMLSTTMLSRPAAALQASGLAPERVQRLPSPVLHLTSSLGSQRATRPAPHCSVRARPQRPPPLGLLPGCGWVPAVPAPDHLRSCCAAVPKWVAEKAVEALKEEHAKPTDRKVAAAAAAALTATASSLQHSKTAVSVHCRVLGWY